MHTWSSYKHFLVHIIASLALLFRELNGAAVVNQLKMVWIAYLLI